MKKAVFVLSFLLAVTACGFRPLYMQNPEHGKDFGTSINEEIAQIKVEPINERFGQLVRNQLLDSLTPKGAPKSPKYRLYVSLDKREVWQQAFRDDITATRERVKYTVKYWMTSSTDAENLMEGSSFSIVSYDILSNPYSTTMTAKKTEKEAAEIIANDISLRIGAYFHTRLSKKEGQNGAL